MDMVTTVIEFVQTPMFTGIAAGLLVISEALASIPAVQANSVFQLVSGILKKLAKKGEA